MAAQHLIGSLMQYSRGMPSGTLTTPVTSSLLATSMVAYSAKLLLNPTPVTLSPGLNPFTALPTSSTIPAGSWPNLSG